MVNKCWEPGCPSNYTKKDVDYKYVPIFSFPKNEDLRNEWKRKIPRDNLVVTHNSKVWMEHFEEKVLWKYDVFLWSNGDSDIIVSETIRYNELHLLRLSHKVFIMHASIPLIHNHMATLFKEYMFCSYWIIPYLISKHLTIKNRSIKTVKMCYGTERP